MLRRTFRIVLNTLGQTDKQLLGFGRSEAQSYINSCKYSLFRLGKYDSCCNNKRTAIFRNFSSQDSEDVPLAKGDKVFQTKLKSTRIDAVLKAGLQMSRNKIEKAFYDDRIRLNGGRPKKKSQTMFEGDEVDLVRGQNRLNPLFVDVSRVELLEMGAEAEEDASGSDSDSDDESKIPAKLKRYKVLTIENYTEAPWKGSDIDSK